MDVVEAALRHRLRQLEAAPSQVQSLTGFAWIVNVGLNAKQYHAFRRSDQSAIQGGAWRGAFLPAECVRRVIGGMPWAGLCRAKLFEPLGAQ